MLDEREWDEAVVESTLSVEELFQEVMMDLAGDRMKAMIAEQQKAAQQLVQTDQAQPPVAAGG